MNVLFIDKSRYFGGAEASLRSLIEGLSKRSVSACCCFDYPMPHQDRILDEAATGKIYRADRMKPWMRESRRRLPPRPLRAMELALSALRLRRCAAGVRPDLVHFNLFRSNILGDVLAAKTLGAKCVFHVRSLSCQIKLPKRVLNLADAVICTSHAVKAEVRDAGCERPLFAVYDPVELEACGDSLTREEARSMLDLPQEDRIVASVGHLEEHKGHDDALRALARLAHVSPRVLLLIVGRETNPSKGVLRRLETLAAGSGVRGRVRFLGETSNVAVVYRAADVVYSLSKVGEAFGRVPIEAAVAGAPSVVFDGGALPEITIDGYSGAVVRSGDHEMLAKVTEEILQNPSLGRCYVDNARSRARRLFGVDAHCERVLNIYHRILTARPEKEVAGLCESA